MSDVPVRQAAGASAARRLGSGATAGEGVQNLLCAAQATTALIALVAAGEGLAVLDPIAALVISAIAIKECAGVWRRDGEDCCALTGSRELGAAVLVRCPRGVEADM